MRGGGAGSNTATDHIEVLDQALASLPEQARPRKNDPEGPYLCVRSDAAGATHDFAAHCATRGVAFSFGFPITQEVRDAIEELDDDEWWEAIDTEEGDVRDGAWVAEVTEMLDLESWPKGSRVVVRKERPHPGAQLSFFDVICGFRHTAFIFAPRSEHEKVTTGIDRLELRHRRHARVEDRIRQGKAAGLEHFPCKEARPPRHPHPQHEQGGGHRGHLRSAHRGHAHPAQGLRAARDPDPSAHHVATTLPGR